MGIAVLTGKRQMPTPLGYLWLVSGYVRKRVVASIEGVSHSPPTSFRNISILMPRGVEFLILYRF